MAGMPMHLACGYIAAERIEDPRGGVPVPLVRMHKSLAPIRIVSARSDEN